MGLEPQYITPLFALLGTLIVALLGFFQWRKQHANPNRAAIAELRRKGIEELWGQLESVNLSLRTLHPSSREAITAAKLSVNKVYLQHSLYLHDELQQLFSQYLESMYKVADLLLENGDDLDQDTWANSTIMNYREDDSELMRQVYRMNELRDVTRTRLLSYTVN